MDTQEEECAANNEKLEMSWDYNINIDPQRDFQCVYADGLLLRKIPGKEIKTKKMIQDTRPSLGVGSKAVRLGSQMSFDDKSVTDKLLGNGLSLASCGDGLKCLKRELAVQHTGACDETLRGSKGKGYRGCQTKTRAGYTCQRWDVQSPHGHATWNTPQTNPNDGLENNNYCRNPDGEPTIWCYTTSHNKRWDFCDARPESGSPIKLTNQTSMKMSAVMTWILLYDGSAHGNIWYAREQDSKYEKYFGIDTSRRVVAGYFDQNLRRERPYPQIRGITSRWF